MTIPAGVTTIGNAAFSNSNLTSITIGAGVTIGNDFSMGDHGAAFLAYYNANGQLAGTYVWDGAGSKRLEPLVRARKVVI